MKHILSALLLILLTACNQEIGISMAIEKQLKTYPNAHWQDIYKNFFQDRFGPGHLISDTASAARYLRYELNAMNIEHNMLYESTGSEGRFVRVNLDVIARGYVSFDTFLDAFLRSANCFELPPIEEWKEEWTKIEKVAIKMGLNKTLPRFDCDSKNINEMLKRGEYVIHHSKEYSKAYQPHYRLIERQIFETEILPKLP